MNRPLVLVGICYLLTLAVAAFFGAGVSAPLFWVCLGMFAASLFVPKLRRAVVVPLALASAAAALGAFSLYGRFAVEPPRALDGKTIAVGGTVCELPRQSNGRWSYIVRVDSAADPRAPVGFKIRLTVQNGMDAGPYSRVSGKIRLYLPPGGEGFDSRGYYASKGVMMFAYPEDFSGLTVSPPAEKPFYYYALRLRQKLIASVEDLLPREEASLVCGLLLGDTDGLSQSLQDDFRAAGVTHMLSVSGLHMSAMAALLLCLFLFLRVPERMASVLTACGVFGFMAVTCFVPPVVRSGVMCLLCLAAPAFSRRADPLNSLCAAGLLICLVNPYAAADVGFLLSFSSTLGLVLCAGPIAARLNHWCDRVRALSPLVHGVSAVLGTSLAAALFTLPVLLPAFGTLSLAAPLANLLMLFPSTLLLGFGAAAALLQLFLPQTFLAMPFALAAGSLAKYLEGCAAWVARLPHASVSASQGYAMLWLAGTLVLFGTAFVMGRGGKLFPQAACLSAIVLLTGVFSFQLAKRDVVRVAVLDAGDGVSVVLQRGSRAAVVGCGAYSSGKVIGGLQAANVTELDCLELLTAGREEFSCAADLSARFRPELFVASQDSMADAFVRSAAQNSSRRLGFASSAEVRLWDGVVIETVSSGKSSAARIAARGMTILVCPKDFVWAALPDEWRTPDFLVTDSAGADLTAVRPYGTIFSMERRSLEKSAARIKRNRSLWTGGSGDIVLELRDSRTLSVGREK